MDPRPRSGTRHVLLAFIASTSVLVAQEHPTSRQERRIEFPLADRAEPLARAPSLVVDIFGRSGGEWAAAVGDQVFKPRGEDFGPDFSEAFAARATTPGFVMLIRADKDAPYRLIHRVLERAAGAAAREVLFETAADGPARRALSCRLPSDEDPLDPEGLPDITLSVKSSRGAIVRTFDINPRAIPPGPKGDDEIERLLRVKYDDYRQLWKAEIPVVVEPHPVVSWVHVVELVNVARKVGIRRIEFALGADPPPEDKRHRPNDEPAPDRLSEEPDVEPSPVELTSRPSPSITLPTSTQAVPFEDAKTIELWIFSEPDATGRDGVKWRWLAGRWIYDFDLAGWKGLIRRLARRAKPGPKAPSEVSLLIRADAKAPFGIVGKTFEAAARAGVYKIHIAAVRDEGAHIEAVHAWLPVARRPSDFPKGIVPEIRVILSWNSEQRRLERIFGQSHPCPTTPEGDAKLERLIKESHESFKAEGQSAPVIIDSGSLVSLQHILNTIDIARRAGVTDIEFGMGTQLH